MSGSAFVAARMRASQPSFRIRGAVLLSLQPPVVIMVELCLIMCEATAGVSVL